MRDHVDQILASHTASKQACRPCAHITQQTVVQSNHRSYLTWCIALQSAVLEHSHLAVIQQELLSCFHAFQLIILASNTCHLQQHMHSWGLWPRMVCCAWPSGYAARTLAWFTTFLSLLHRGPDLAKLFLQAMLQCKMCHQKGRSI